MCGDVNAFLNEKSEGTTHLRYDTSNAIAFFSNALTTIPHRSKKETVCETLASENGPNSLPGS